MPNTPLELSSFALKVRQFVLERKPELQNTSIDDTTDLIDSRIIDSLMFVEFLLFLEDHFGRTILVNSGDIDSFRTIRSIHGSLHERHLPEEQGVVNE